MSVVYNINTLYPQQSEQMSHNFRKQIWFTVWRPRCYKCSFCFHGYWSINDINA